MASVIPLSDASRRPVRFPFVTLSIIVINVLVFVQELMAGDAFVLKWAAVPANITAGHQWITLLTSMFMHGSWSHIIGNMVFLWAFGPEIDESIDVFDLLPCRRAGGHAGTDRGKPHFHRSKSGSERRDCGRYGRISRHVSSRSDSLASNYILLPAYHLCPSSSLDRRLVLDAAGQLRVRCRRPDRRSSVCRACWWRSLWSAYGASF